MSLRFTTLHYTTLHSTTLHYTTLQLQLQLHNYTTTQLHSTTLHYTIRLSNVQQMALPFCAFDEVPRLLWSQGFLADAFLHL